MLKGSLNKWFRQRKLFFETWGFVIAILNAESAIHPQKRPHI